MNVLFLQPALPLYRVPFFERLHQTRGLRVTVWSDHNATLHARNSRVEFSIGHRPERHVRGFVWQPALLEAVRDSWADVIVASWNTRYVHLLPALLEARLRGKPLVLWGHGYSKQEQPWLRQLRNRYGQLATACVTYSELTRARLLTEGLSPSLTFCAPNALHDAPLRTAMANTWDAVRLREFARTRALGENTVLFVSRLEADKQLGLLIEAFALVRAAVPDAQLVVVGTGSEAGKVQHHVRALELGDSVVMTGAIYNEHDLAPLFLSSKVFAYPAAIGLSLLHAFSYGLPVVTAHKPEHHNPEFDALIPNQNGLTYIEGDVADFARQIVSVLTNDALRSTLSQGAIESVSPPHGKTLTAMVDGMRAALEYADRTSA